MNIMEKCIISSAVFLGSIPFLGMLLGWLHLLHWWTVLPCCLVLAVLFFLRANITDVDSNYSWYALALFVLFACVMFFGTFRYSWLEDDDPYGYAVVAQYVAEKGTFVKSADLYLENYAEPDSIGYSVFLATWYDLTGRMNFTVKFFNTLVVCLSLLWFYVFAKSFFGSEKKAFFATLVLLCIPSFLTHFAFATTLALALFFPALYFITEDRQEFYSFGVFLIASILVTHHLVGFVFGLFFLTYLAFNRKTSVFFTGFVGFSLSLFYWVPELWKYGITGFMKQLGIDSATSISGTADRLYGIKDFLFAPSQNMINTSTGWGIFIFLLVAVSAVLLFTRKREKRDGVMWTWFGITLIGVLAVYLPWKLMPFRWWSFLAIPVALLAGTALFDISERKTTHAYLLMAAFIAGLLAFSFYPKVLINTSVWGPSGSLQQPGVLDAHLWMMDKIPANTPVFSFHSANKLQGFNMWSCEWCLDEIAFKQRYPIETEELREFLQNKSYRFVMVPVSWYVAKYGEDLTRQQLASLDDLDAFYPVYKTDYAIVYSVIWKVT